MLIRLLLLMFISIFLLVGCDKRVQQQTQQPNPTKIPSMDTSSFSSTPTAPTENITTITPKEESAIKEAINVYLSQQNSSLANATDIIFDKRDGEFVRVKLKPTHSSADTAIAFLKYKDTQWHVISIGTAFEMSFYLQNDIPQSLILGK